MDRDFRDHRAVVSLARMTERDLLNRSIEAGKDVTQRTQGTIEALVPRAWPGSPRIRPRRSSSVLQEFIELSRATTEQIVEVIDRELRRQINALGLATRDRHRPARADRQSTWHARRALHEGSGQEGDPPRRRPPRRSRPRRRRPRRPRPRRRRRRRRRPKKATAKKATVDPIRQEGGHVPVGQEGRRLAPAARASRVTTPPRRRLDAELVRRGLAPSREQAQAAIAAGRVTRRRRAGHKAAAWSAPASRRLVGPPPGSSAGAARSSTPRSTASAVDVAGPACLDAGASTGGFTDCLLQRGAAEVVAVDVGYGQLHERLRADPGSTCASAPTSATSPPRRVGGPVDVVVADLSFISLRTVLDALRRRAPRPGADWCCW